MPTVEQWRHWKSCLRRKFLALELRSREGLPDKYKLFDYLDFIAVTPALAEEVGKRARYRQEKRNDLKVSRMFRQLERACDSAWAALHGMIERRRRSNQASPELQSASASLSRIRQWIDELRQRLHNFEAIQYPDNFWGYDTRTCPLTWHDVIIELGQIVSKLSTTKCKASRKLDEASGLFKELNRIFHIEARKQGRLAMERVLYLHERLYKTPTKAKIPDYPEHLADMHQALMDWIDERIVQETHVTATNSEAKGQKEAAPGITKDEANVRAREILGKNPHVTARELAEEIPCSLGLVSQLPAWQAVKERLRKGQKPKTPKAVSLTGKMQAVIPDPRQEKLGRLIKEQEADMREDNAVNPKFRKRRKP